MPRGRPGFSRAAAVVVAAVVVACAAAAAAQSRSAMLLVRVNVLRSCSVRTQPGAAAVTVTCSRGATPGIVASSRAPDVRQPVPIRTDRSTVEIATPGVASALPVALELIPETLPVEDAGMRVAFELVTINF